MSEGGPLVDLAIASVSFVTTLIVMVFLPAYHDGWRPRLARPPYQPPPDPLTWRVGAALRLYPRPTQPCGCPATWDDVSYISEPEPDGTLYESIGSFSRTTYDFSEIRHLTEDNGGVWVDYTYNRVHTCTECGGAWPEQDRRGDRLRGGRRIDSLTTLTAGPTMTLPENWNEVDEPFGQRGGQVAQYVTDDYDAFIDIFEARIASNPYDRSNGEYVGLLLTGTPDGGVWERERRAGDDRDALLDRLLSAYETTYADTDRDRDGDGAGGTDDE